jgi:hypothetical protein
VRAVGYSGRFWIVHECLTAPATRIAACVHFVTLACRGRCGYIRCRYPTGPRPPLAPL